jgi:hypothetical protein
LSSRAKALVLLFLIFPLPLCALLYATRTTPRAGYVGIEGFTYRTDYNHTLMGLVALAVGAGLLFEWGAARMRDAKGEREESRLRTAALVCLVAFAGLLYFYGSRAGKTHYPWFHDSYHYYLGAKYFPELGYDQLYGCHLVADAQRAEPRYLDTDAVNDLAVDALSTAGAVRAKADCRAFTPERWAEFQRDTAFFDTVTGKDILRDRGYNGTPFLTLLVGRVAAVVDIGYENLVALAFVDITAICALLAVITWAFGARIGTLFALFFFTNFADRFNFVGASTFRYLWMASAGVGVACLKKKWPARGAAFLALAGMLSAFPAFFLAGIGVKSASSLLGGRGLDPGHRRFLVSGALTAAGLFALSLAQARPLRNYEDFLSIMRGHSQATSSLRVGFRYDFLSYETIASGDSPAGDARKADDLRRTRFLYYPLAAAILVFGCWLARRMDDVGATVLLGLLVLFLCFSTATYYYAVTALLLLLAHEPEDSSIASLFAALLFLGTAGMYLLWYRTDNALGLLCNTAMSGALTLYLACTIGYWARRHRVSPGV